MTGTNLWEVRVLGADIDGLPDEQNVLETFSNVVMPTTTREELQSSLITLNSVLHPVLNSGQTYWVAIGNCTLGKDLRVFGKLILQ